MVIITERERKERATLWNLIVAPSGSGKSNVTKAAITITNLATGVIHQRLRDRGYAGNFRHEILQQSVSDLPSRDT